MYMREGMQDNEQTCDNCGDKRKKGEKKSDSGRGYQMIDSVRANKADDSESEGRLIGQQRVNGNERSMKRSERTVIYQCETYELTIST